MSLLGVVQPSFEPQSLIAFSFENFELEKFDSLYKETRFRCFDLIVAHLQPKIEKKKCFITKQNLKKREGSIRTVNSHSLVPATTCNYMLLIFQLNDP